MLSLIVIVTFTHLPFPANRLRPPPSNRSLRALAVYEVVLPLVDDADEVGGVGHAAAFVPRLQPSEWLVDGLVTSPVPLGPATGAPTGGHLADTPLWSGRV